MKKTHLSKEYNMHYWHLFRADSRLFWGMIVTPNTKKESSDQRNLRNFGPLNDIIVCPAYTSGAKLDLTVDGPFTLQIWSPKSRSCQFHSWKSNICWDFSVSYHKMFRAWYFCPRRNIFIVNLLKLPSFMISNVSLEMHILLYFN